MQQFTDLFKQPKQVSHQVSGDFSAKDLLQYPFIYYASKLLLCAHMRIHMTGTSEQDTFLLQSGYRLCITNLNYDGYMSDAYMTVQIYKGTSLILEVHGCIANTILPISAKVLRIDILEELDSECSILIIDEIENVLNICLSDLNKRSRTIKYGFGYDIITPTSIPTMRLSVMEDQSDNDTTPVANVSLKDRYSKHNHTNFYESFFDNILLDQPVLAFSADMLMVSYLNSLMNDSTEIIVGDYLFKQIYDPFNHCNYTTEVIRQDGLFYKIVGTAKLFGQSVFVNTEDLTLLKTLTLEEQRELIGSIRRCVKDMITQGSNCKNSKHLKEFEFEYSSNRIFGESQLKWRTK